MKSSLILLQSLWLSLFQKPRATSRPLNSSGEKNQTNASIRRLDYLDSIRGIASLAVIGWHYFEAYNMPLGCTWWITKPLVTLFYDGGAAVCIFFVVSGFVLSLKPVRFDVSHYFLLGDS